MRKVSLCLLFLALGVLLIAQSPQPKPAHAAPPPAKASAPASLTTFKAVPPEPTEVERVKLENLQLRMALLQDEENSLPQRRQQIQSAYSALIEQIQREHPGYLWNPQSSSLIPAPQPATAKKGK